MSQTTMTRAEALDTIRYYAQPADWIEDDPEWLGQFGPLLVLDSYRAEYVLRTELVEAAVRIADRIIPAGDVVDFDYYEGQVLPMLASALPALELERQIAAGQVAMNFTAAPTSEIEAGDFIAARGTTCIGFAIERAAIRFGRKSIAGWRVRLADEREDFISDDRVKLVHPSDEHFERVITERRHAAAETPPAPVEVESTPQASAITVEKEQAAITAPVVEPEALPAAIVSADEFDYDRAVQAHNWNSFHPEERARLYQREYVADVQGLYDALLPLAKSDEARALLLVEIARYKENYLKYFYALLAATGRTASSFVTGPANFPTARNQKRLETEDRRRVEFLDWRTRAQKAMRAAIAAVGQEPVDEVAQITRKLETRRKQQALMVAANKCVRKNDRAGLAALGLGETNITKLFIPDFAGRIGFPAYELTNNNAEIHRLEARLAELAAREQAQETFTAITGDGWRIYAEDERVCIDFEQIPPAELRTALKGCGFKWSPTRGAWVRAFTTNALHDARRILAA
jgi:hypothetical protein